MSWGVMAQQLGWGIIEEGWRKGPWTAEEDRKLIEYVKLHGEGRWNSVARLAGLKRNGKSCRLRWVNYLRPDLKRGQITPQEEKVILELHARWGNRWSTIARSLPGRTDNEIKNYWRTHFKKKTKTSNNTEKSRARLLRKQQFQQQQMQLQHQMDMRKIVSSLLDENDQNVLQTVPLMMQDMPPTSYQTTTITTDQEQSFLYSLLNGYATVPEVSSEETVMWDGIWNMDDHFHGNFNTMPLPNSYKATMMPAFATPFH